MANKTLKINGREYSESDFNDAARNLLRNIAITDEKIRNLKQELALFQVAREAFGSALLAHLPASDQPDAAAASAPGGSASH
jgi:hypothetical protein